MKRTVQIAVCAVAGFLGLQSVMADVTMSLDAASTNFIPINPRIYGVNIANWAADHYARNCSEKLKEADVSVIRYGATNIERYNWRNNRMYNVISLENQYVPMSWRTFLDWCEDMDAEPFIQVPMFGQVASDIESSNYNSNQPISEIAAWVDECGDRVNIWGIGNEPFIAWKLVQYQGDGYKYNDGAHGDQIFLEDLDPNVYFDRWVDIGAAIKGANTNASILGPTPANWYLYWGTDFSEFCPSTRARSAAWPDHLNPDGHVNDAGWQVMADGMNQFDGRVFPGRAGQPGIIGWEQNAITGEFNDKRNMNMFALKCAEYAAANGGTQVCSYLDFHRYMNTDKEGSAIQETRDLWENGFQSDDMETGFAHDARILDRFRNLLDHYNPEMGISLSEYDYFYWRGHPNNPQTAALGEIDFLGIFARLGVQLACNWYIGEPDQSGGGYHHAADSAKQAMFNEKSEPNPKYWAFRLMSKNFRDQALTSTHVSDNSLFSLYSGVDTNANELTVAAYYKGIYYPNDDAHHPGAFIEGQGNTNATMVISNFNITGVRSVQRFGEHDPEIITMEPGGVTVTDLGGGVQTFDYTFEPLSAYVFTFYGDASPPAEAAPDTYLNVYPREMAFGAFNTGVEITEIEDHDHGTMISTSYTFAVRISNNRNTPLSWNVSEGADWLTIHGETNGLADATHMVYLFCDREGYDTGVYTTDLTVQTSEGTVVVPVSMEVVPREEGGEARICDFDTGSLAHAWAFEEPYAVGFYDQHGQPADMEGPYIYEMYLDSEDTSPYGGVAAMRVDFDRSNGDTEGGKLYTAFGTYGHTSGTNTCPTTMWVPPGQPLSNYVFKFDVKTETEGFGETSTKLLVTVTDVNGDVGKPSTGISDFKETMAIQDGFWQTVSTPLDRVFYDWKWPGGQTGDVVNLDFSAIDALSFAPWNGSDDKKGSVWIDNIRIETLHGGSNRFPVSVIAENVFEIYTNQTAQLDASGSYDPDGTIASYQWTPSVGLSDPNIANPVFTPPSAGTYVFSLEVTDNNGLKGRDAAQVIIYAQESLVPSEVVLYRDAEMTQPITDGVISNCFDLYVKYVCTAGGDSTRVDTTRATFSSDNDYGNDGYNNVDPLSIVLKETAEDSLIFTGAFRLSAFSDEAGAELGVQVGDTVSFSNLFYQSDWLVGDQTFGLETIVNHIEDGVDGYNCFDGVWYTYDDSGEGCASTIALTSSSEAATPYSKQSARLYSVLDQGVSTNPDVIFSGAANKLTQYETEIQHVACVDVSSTSGYEGVSFRFKGNGTRVTVVLKSLGVTNYDDYAYTVEHTPTNEWRQYLIPFSWFEQEGWGREAVARDAALRQLNSIQFKFSSHIDGQTNVLYVDDLAFFGGTPYYLPHPVYHKLNTTTMDGFDGGLLANPGFSTTGGGWVLTNNATYEAWGDPPEPRLVMENWNATVGSASQVLNIQDDKAYQFFVDAWKNSGYNARAFMELYWYDSGNTLLRLDSKELTSELIQDVPQTFTMPWGWAPVGATTVKLVLSSLDATVPPYTDNCMQFDNAGFYEYGLNADDGWISGWIPGSTTSYTNDCAEGNGALCLASTNTGWLAGMFVAPYGSETTRTNLAPFDGFAIKARRANGFGLTGDSQARIRIAVCTNEDPVARTRWYPVHASEWEDYILFAKDKFLTAATVDNDDPATRVPWTNDWTSLTRIIVEYGPAREDLKPVNVFVDDFRPYYADGYGPDNVTNPPIIDPTLPDVESTFYDDEGFHNGFDEEFWNHFYPSTTSTTSSWNRSMVILPITGISEPAYADGTAPEGATSCRVLLDDYTAWSIWASQACVHVGGAVGDADQVIVQGNTMFVLDAQVEKVTIHDVTDPENIVVGTSFSSTTGIFNVDQMAVADGYCYIADNTMECWNVSDPANPSYCSSVSLPTLRGMQTAEVSGDYLYYIPKTSSRDFQIIDISDPFSMTARGNLSLTGFDGKADILLNGNYAYVTMGDIGGLTVVNISNPDLPTLVTNLPDSNGVSLAKVGNYLYQMDQKDKSMITGYADLRIWDISNPALPVLVNDRAMRVNYSGFVYDMEVAGQRVYLNFGDRLRVVDCSVATNPVLAGYSSRHRYPIYDVAVKGDYALAGTMNGTFTYDASSLGSSTNLTQFANGFLKFWIKTPVDLNVRVRAGGVDRMVKLSEHNWSGDSVWQEMVIPVRSFRFSDEELENVYQPFALELFDNVDGGLECYVDDVRYRTLP